MKSAEEEAGVRGSIYKDLNAVSKRKERANHSVNQSVQLSGGAVGSASQGAAKNSSHGATRLPHIDQPNFMLEHTQKYEPPH